MNLAVFSDDKNSDNDSLLRKPASRKSSRGTRKSKSEKKSEEKSRGVSSAKGSNRDKSNVSKKSQKDGS